MPDLDNATIEDSPSLDVPPGVSGGRRRRGRPRSASLPDQPPASDASPSPQGSQDRAPRGRKPKTKVTPAQVKGALTVAVVGLDTILSVGSNTLTQPGQGFWEPQDRLEAQETAAIVGAVYRELETYPKAMALFQRAIVGGVHAQLAAVLLAVAVPRLARRGLLPEQMVLLSMSVMAAYAGEETAQTVATNGVAHGVAAGGVETGATPGGSWGNGYGQDHAPGVPVGGA